MRKLIYGGTIVNEGQAFQGAVVIENDRIAEIIPTTETPRGIFDQKTDATGCFVLPGVIDDHVHFREPGLTDKADIESESRAAAYGGVTTYFDMPNTIPQTTTLTTLADKRERAARESHVNYAFFYGATNDNANTFAQLDRHRTPGIKLFMGSSTGNMLVDQYGSLLNIFREAARLEMPLMAHCEDTDTIERNMAQMQKAYGDDPDVMLHPLIRSEEACFESSALAVQLARTFGTRLHVAHVSTAREVDMLRSMRSEGQGAKVTAEACIAHLYFSNEDYAVKRALIKCNPAIKGKEDRETLRKALLDGSIATIGTDHAPHLLSQKQGGCRLAASGMPMVQFSLVTMLELVDEGVLPIERMVTLMCHQPAQLFEVHDRGFLRPGYKADVVVVSRDVPWTVTREAIQSKCGWSPMEGHTYQWHVCQTYCNGLLVVDQGRFDAASRGEEVLFR